MRRAEPDLHGDAKATIPQHALDHLGANSRLHHNTLLALEAARHEGALGVLQALVVRAPFTEPQIIVGLAAGFRRNVIPNYDQFSRRMVRVTEAQDEDRGESHRVGNSSSYPPPLVTRLP